MSNLKAMIAGLAVAGSAFVSPALGAGWTPEAGSPVDLAGEAVLYFVDEGLLEANRGNFNPFEIDGELLLQHVSLFFVTVDYEGQGVNEGEIAIYPQFRTPMQSSEASAVTPAAIYFAFKQVGRCYGGYVAGFPVPTRTVEVDMSGQICHAAIVENLLLAEYQAVERGRSEARAALEAAGVELLPAPAGPVVPADEHVPPSATAVENFDPAFPTDLDLEVIVWAAYNAAYARASANGDYFARTPEETDALVAEMRREVLAEGFRGVAILGGPENEQQAGATCSPAGQTVLRFALNPAGDGIVLAAVSDRRVAGQKFEPSESEDLDVLAPRDCATRGPARAGITSY